MNTEIEAIFLDLGNTLRMLEKNEAIQSAAKQRIVELVGSKEDPDKFCIELDERYKTYRKWAFETLKEAPEDELWTRWMAPEFPKERIAPLGVDLTYLYRRTMGERVVVDGGKEVVVELHRRGYILGIISNLTSSREIPEWMDADGFTPYFKSVVLSSVIGIRKPDPAIYHEATRQAGVDPGKCVYVGDNLKRDVTGTRAAGFGMVVIMISPDELAKEEITEENRPDAIIYQFKELLQMFPRSPQVCLENNHLVKP